MTPLLDHEIRPPGAPTPLVRELSFGPFRLDLMLRVLFRGPARIRLGSRAIAILTALVERPGVLVSKAELLKAAWPTTFVDEGTLRVHLAAIRRALDDDAQRPVYIVNVMGKGYRFIAEVSAPSSLALLSAPRHPVWAMRRLLGRDDDQAAVVRMAAKHRLVTIVGPGGVGKSALAARAAQGPLRQRHDRLVHIDVAGNNGLARLEEVLRGSPLSSGPAPRTLVVLDSCEHLIADVAEFVEAALARMPDLAILATSVEPIRVAEERIFRLEPLPSPRRIDMPLKQALTYPAVQLLVDLITDGQMEAVAPRDVRALLSVSRRLDGFPLAIEMAATSIAFMGIRGLLDQMESFEDLPLSGARTAMTRHRSMRRLSEWSQSGLSPLERQILQRLAVFAEAFAMDDAIHIAASPDIASSEIVSCVSDLVTKSHLTKSRTVDAMTYRMPRHIRSFHRTNLQSTEEYPVVGRRHSEWAMMRARELLASMRRISGAALTDSIASIADDLLEALAFSYSSAGERTTAVALTLAAAPILLRRGRFAETRNYLTEALRDPLLLTQRQTLQLTLLRAVIQEDLPPASPDCRSIVDQIAAFRTSLGSPAAEAEVHLIEAVLCLRAGKLADGLSNANLALEHARQAGERQLQLTALRVMTELLHYDGAREAFHDAAKQTLASPTVLSPLFGTVTTPPEGAIGVLKARELWLSGFPDLALEQALSALEVARAAGPWASCEALALGVCPVLMWRGDHGAAQAHIDELGLVAEMEGLPHWQAWTALYRAALTSGTPALPQQFNVAPGPASFLQAETWATITGTLSGSSFGGRKASGWCAPEIMRVEAVAARSKGDLEAAQYQLLFARDLAVEKNSVAWELRISIDLAAGWRGEPTSRASDMLASSLGRLEGGKDTRDYARARELLSALQRRAAVQP